MTPTEFGARKKDMPNMIRKSKVLGLILAAMFAMGAVASTASAAEFHFGQEHTILQAQATGVQKFSTGGKTIECTAAGSTFTLHTQIPKTTSAITASVLIDTGACVTTFPPHVDFATDECDFSFPSNSGEVHLLCTKAGGVVKYTPTMFGASLCTTHLYPGTYKGVAYANNGTKTAFTVHREMTGIKTIVTGGGGFCGAEGETTTSYIGNVTVTGTDTAGNAVAVWWE